MHPRACVLDRNRALIQPMEHSPTRAPLPANKTAIVSVVLLLAALVAVVGLAKSSITPMQQ
jgi:hypothetical protein